MELNYIVAFVLLTLSIIASICLVIVLSKKEEKPNTLKVAMIGSLCVLFGSIAYLSIATATGQLMPKKLLMFLIHT